MLAVLGGGLGAPAARRCRVMLATAVAGAVAVTPALAASATVAGTAPAGGVAMAASSVAAPADSIRDSQSWVLNMLDVWNAWKFTQGAGVTVAVLDSGVDPEVSDLAGSVKTDPHNLTGLNTLDTNPNWGVHGTWMASIIAGHGHGFDGDSGIIGIAPEAKILSIRVIPDSKDPGYHTYEAEPEQTIQDSLATGIKDAVSQGAKVISMSIGYSSPSLTVRAAVQYADKQGVVLVASSGNSGHDDQRRDHGFAPVSFPADYPGVLSVGAVDSADKAAGFSSNNLSVQVAAPGVQVPAQGRDGQYWTVDGTSPACALVAGVAALIKAKYPNLSPALVLEALTSTAQNTSSHGYDVRTGTGFGTVDAAKALHAAGILARAHAAGSQVVSSEHFGGGSAAIPAAPVPPRGAAELVLFALLAIVSLAVVVASGVWLTVLGRPRKGVHAAYPGPSGPRYPAGDSTPGTEYGGQDDGWQRQ